MKKITLPFLPISTNQLNISRGGRLRKSPKARDFKDLLITYLMQYELKDFGNTYQGKGVIVSITYFMENFYTKKGEISKTAGDVSNRDKALIDVIFPIIGINDSDIVDMYLSKREGETRTEIVISFL
jgi:Holliday junction resolvase RusA-like endonuclease